MRFQRFWERLSVEIGRGKKFTTLKRGAKFKAKMEGNKVVATPDSTGMPRNIPISQFEEMWHTMRKDPRNRRYVNIGGRYSHLWNPSYISALTDHIVQDSDMQ